MKLFYSAGACSLASHIVMAELNMVYEIEAVDLRKKTCASGDYRAINPKGSVPALIMDNGDLLTESAVIIQFLAEQKMEAGLMPKYGTMERYRCIEMINFIATDLHKSFTPLFISGMIFKNEEGKAEMMDFYKNMIKAKVAFVSQKLGSNDYLFGKQFTVADAYLFTVLSWSNLVGVDLSQHENVMNYLKRVGERPAVMKAMKEEGLLK